MASHTLIVPFLDENPQYAYGVEFGLLYARMRDEEVTVIDDIFCRGNQEQILLAANRMNWRVAKVKAVDKDWFRCRLERRTPHFQE